ncbi:MAG: septal ring lytic transglycosylase RlpA family protein, partial [Terriglobales bacterium]
MMDFRLIFALFLAFLLAPVPAPRTARPGPRPARAEAASLPWQVGMASWYGAEFQGRETTDGEHFNMYALTAAHRTLPFGTRVRVTNLLNQRSVILRINDRGPVPVDRVVDLSYAAARALDACEDGVFPVRIELVPKPDPSDAMLRWDGWKKG